MKPMKYRNGREVDDPQQRPDHRSRIVDRGRRCGP